MKIKTYEPWQLREEVMPAHIFCAECGKELKLLGKLAASARSRDRAYFSKECGMKAFARSSSATMSRTNRKYASARMIARNPMKRADVRAKHRPFTKRACDGFA